MNKPSFPYTKWIHERIRYAEAEDRQRARTPWIMIGGAVIVASVVFVLKLFPR